jgi:hypothetical protein
MAQIVKSLVVVAGEDLALALVSGATASDRATEPWLETGQVERLRDLAGAVTV